jgi:hypothetical protein
MHDDSQAPKDAVPVTAPTRRSGLSETFAQAPSFGMVLAIAGAILAIGAIGGYAAIQHVLKQVPRVGTVDIAAVVQLKHLALAPIAFRANATAAEKEKANRDIERFGPELEAALAETRTECDCILLVRSAFVTGSATDYTERLKVRLGLDKVSPRDLEKLVQLGGHGKTPAAERTDEKK